MRRCYRILIPILILSILLSGCAVGTVSGEEGTPVSLFYEYRDAELVQDLESIIGQEQRTVSVLSLWDFLDQYLQGPESEEMISPFPAGTRILEIQYTNSIPTITMSGEFFSLMGVDLSIACCCLAKTVCDFTGRDSMILLDETDSIRMEIDPEKYALTNSIQNDLNEPFTIYFPDTRWRYLISEVRDATLSTNETQAAYVLRQLLEGPENNQLASALPKGTRLLGISIADSICTVNFSEEFVSGMSQNPNHVFLSVYAVVNSLTGLEDIEAVQFLSEGNEISDYGILRLDVPVSRYTDCIGPVRTAAGEVDANLYLRTMSDSLPFTMPCRVKQTISEPLAEAVARGEALEADPCECPAFTAGTRVYQNDALVWCMKVELTL